MLIDIVCVRHIDINVPAGPSTVGSRAPRGLWSPAGQAGLVFPALIMLVAGQSPAEASEFNTGSTPARHVPYLLVRVRVRPERHRAQSCAIPLRSPAPERSSDLKLLKVPPQLPRCKCSLPNERRRGHVTTLAFLLFLTGFCLLGDSHNHGYLLLRVSDEVRCVHTWMGVGLWVGGWMGGVVYGQRHRSASSLYQCNLPQARAAQVLLRADLARRHTSRTNPPAERETDTLLRL